MHSIMHSTVQITGHRRITPAMLNARLMLRERPEPTTLPEKSQIIYALKRGYKALDLTMSQRNFLLYLVDCTLARDWTDQGGLIIAAPSNRHLADELEIGESRIKALVRQLAEKGYILPKDSHNGSRRIKRTRAGGPIVWGYGFDLTPLRKRWQELDEAVEATRDRQQEAESLRRRIREERNEIRSLAAMAKDEGGGNSTDEIIKETEALAAFKRTERDPQTLSRIYVELVALKSRLERLIISILPVKSTPQEALKVSPNTTTNTNILSKDIVEKNESPLKRPQFTSNEGGSRRLMAHEDEPVAAPVPVNKNLDVESPLKGFIATPNFLTKISSKFRQVIGHEKSTESQAIEAAEYVAADIGISRHAWGQACITLGGRYNSAVCVAIIAAKYERGLVRSPGGLLRGMIDRHRAGTLNLDRTLYGLADTINCEMGRV